VDWDLTPTGPDRAILIANSKEIFNGKEFTVSTDMIASKFSVAKLYLWQIISMLFPDLE
jgi:hypothetical protein